MASLEQLQGRLQSLEELRTIVKTMKALSAASIRQYEQAVDALGDYYRTVERGLQVVLRDTHGLPPTAAGRGRPARLAAVVFGSDHGLCGRFNEEITEHAIGRMGSVHAETSNRLVLAVGARVAASLEHENQPVAESFLLTGSAAQITQTVQQVLLQIDTWREREGVRYVQLFYNRHAEGRTYRPTGVELLPLGHERFARLRGEHWPTRQVPVYRQERRDLLRRLIHQYLFVSVFRACAESQASEHASRLTAMQSAERNLDERISDVTMAYRRARQDTITAELLDVVAGFEAISAAESG